MAPQVSPRSPSWQERPKVEVECDDLSTFINPRLGPGELPSLDLGGFEPVAPAFATMRLLAVGLAGLVATAAVLFLGLYLVDRSAALVGVVAGALLALFAALAWFQRVEVRYMGYQVRAHDFSFRRGVVWRRVDTMPFARVQHAVIRRGPVERLFNLATLHLRSAGGSLLVTGLDAERAERLKTLVVERAGALADEELVDQS